MPSSIIDLQLFKYAKSVRRSDTRLWDPIRSKWIIATPEEWVRQSLIQYLVRDRQWPRGLMAVERSIKLYEQRKRWDLVLYDLKSQPVVICECKRPEIALDQNVLEQVGRYNIELKVPHIMLINGEQAVFIYQAHQPEHTRFSDEIPDYETLCSSFKADS